MRQFETVFPSLPPLFRASSLSLLLSPSMILPLYHRRYRSAVYAAFKTNQPWLCYAVNIQTTPNQKQHQKK